MSITLNIHRTTGIEVHENAAEGSQWTTIKCKNRDGLSHDITLFDVTLLDFVNALEKAMHKEPERIDNTSVDWSI